MSGRAWVRGTWISLTGAAVVVVACSSPSTKSGTQTGDDGGTEGTTSQVVGASGGTVTTGDGTQVVIPPGALAGDVTITIAPNASAPALTQGFSVAPAHVFGPEGQQFLVPVSVTLAFQQNGLPHGTTEQQVVVFAAPQGSSDYQVLPTTIADATHVTGQTTHFSNLCPGVPHGDSGIVDSGGGGDSAVDVASCPAASGIENAAAQACASQSCCAQLTTCTSDPACSPAGACFDANCQGNLTQLQVQQCAAQCAADASANGATEFNAAFNCIQSLCATD